MCGFFKHERDAEEPSLFFFVDDMEYIVNIGIGFRLSRVCYSKPVFCYKLLRTELYAFGRNGECIKGILLLSGLTK